MNVLWPPKKCETSDDNFQSLVLQLTISGKSFLLMGDVPSSVESKLLRNSLDQQYLLLVSHHGSNTATSEPFLRQTMPENIVISVGKNNRYGHPNPQTIHRIAKVEGRVLMTSKNGRIHFTFKNQQVSFNCVKSWDK
jgi:competence protein ComEC